jgi:hypothetical protein
MRATAPAITPAGRTGEAAATKAGFHAVYEGETRIWFHSWPAIWYVSVEPGGTGLSAAALSPVGVKVLQVHGGRDRPLCTVSVPGAERLKPYGEALWAGLLWALADNMPAGGTAWTGDGDTVSGEARRGSTSVRYSASATNGTLQEKTVLDGRRRTHEIRLSDQRQAGDRSYPGTIEVKCLAPRCVLTLKLKSIRWNDGKSPDATGP